MARITKRGLDYFPMDIDAFYDARIRKLIKFQGGKSISVYALLLCNIYKNGYYVKWNEELTFTCSQLTGSEEAFVTEVVKLCLAVGLFSKPLFDVESVLTSKDIQERYLRVCSQCRRSGGISEYSLLEPTPQKSPATAISQADEKNHNTLGQYSLTLEQEIQALKADGRWLDQLTLLHGWDANELRNRLDEFRLLRIADGKNAHQSLSDAKQHFNSWIRIKTLINRTDNVQNRCKGRNQRRGHVLTTDEQKTYGDSF